MTDHVDTVHTPAAGTADSAQQRTASLAPAGGPSVAPGLRGLLRRRWPLVLLALLSAYLLVAWTLGLNRAVYLVNGLELPYAVTLGVQRHTLRPGEPLEVRVREGRIEVAVQEPSLGIPPLAVEVRTPLWSRPFARVLFVINPDGAAVLFRETVRFAAGAAAGGGQGSATLHVGLPLYVFPRPDVGFGEPPRTPAPAGKAVSRTRVGLVPSEVPVGQVLQAVAQDLGLEAAALLASRRLAGAPDSLDYLQFLAGTVKPEALAELLKPGLAARPLRVEWHRAYQDARRDAGYDEDLRVEYRELLDREPEEPALHYLLGRVAETGSAAEQHFLRSTAGDQPCPYGHHALAHKYLSRGEFKTAVEHGAKAVAQQPGHPGFCLAYNNALQAAGQHEAALAELRRQTTAPGDTGLLLDEVQVRIAQAGPEAAEQCITDWLAALGNTGAPAETLAQIGQSMRIHAAYVAGDLERFAAGARESRDPMFAFAEALSAGRVADADAALAQIKPPNAAHHLLVFVASQRAGLEDLASRHLDAAVAVLRQGHYAQRAIASLLAGEQPFVFAELDNLALDPHSKVVYLAALGLLYPNQQAECFALARVLNYRRLFPHHFLASIVGGPPAP